MNRLKKVTFHFINTELACLMQTRSLLCENIVEMSLFERYHIQFIS